MAASTDKKITVFFVLSLVSLVGLIVSSIVLINRLGMNGQLQGWVNLLWIPLPLVILIIDRICVSKFATQKVNRVQWYILGTLTVLFILNLARLHF